MTPGYSMIDLFLWKFISIYLSLLSIKKDEFVNFCYICILLLHNLKKTQAKGPMKNLKKK